MEKTKTIRRAEGLALGELEAECHAELLPDRIEMRTWHSGGNQFCAGSSSVHCTNMTVGAGSGFLFDHGRAAKFGILVFFGR